MGWGILAAAVLIPLAGGQTTVSTVDGVVVVKNGKRPVPPPGAAAKLVLDPDFTVGGGASPEQEFASITALEVRDDGSVLVLDTKDCAVRAFDASGRFLFSFGKKGQGPGELNMPTGLVNTPSGEILVEDTLNRRLAVFSPAGKFLRNQALPQEMGIGGLTMDSHGRIAARSIAFADGKIGYEIKTYDRDFKPGKTLTRMDMGSPQQMKVDLLSGVAGIVFGLDARGNIYVGSPKGYLIRVFDFDGRLVRTIGREYDPIPVDKKEQERMAKVLGAMPTPGGRDPKDMYVLPDAYPAYANFIVNRDGRLLVRTYEKAKPPAGNFHDVFDAEGRFILHAPFTMEFIAWRDDRLYGLDENEDGYPVLKCFRARWEKGSCP